MPYHGQEETKFGVHIDIVSIREDERGFLLVLTSQDDIDLLGSDGQHREFDTIELIETTPGTYSFETTPCGGEKRIDRVPTYPIELNLCRYGPNHDNPFDPSS